MTDKKFFINLVPNKETKKHQIRINEWIFKLESIATWKFLGKIFIEYFNYVCILTGEDFHKCMKEIINKINKDLQAFKTRMGYLLGDWRQF